MCPVINAIEQRNFPIITFNFHVLTIYDELSAKAFPVAVITCDIIVVGKYFQLLNDASVCCPDSYAMSTCKCSNACAFEMKIK